MKNLKCFCKLFHEHNVRAISSIWPMTRTLTVIIWVNRKRTSLLNANSLTLFYFVFRTLHLQLLFQKGMNNSSRCWLSLLLNWSVAWRMIMHDFSTFGDLRSNYSGTIFAYHYRMWSNKDTTAIKIVSSESLLRWLETVFRNAYWLYSKRSKPNFPLSQWDRFHACVDQRIEVSKSGRGITIAVTIVMLTLWRSPVKQYLGTVSKIPW